MVIGYVRVSKAGDTQSLDLQRGRTSGVICGTHARGPRVSPQSGPSRVVQPSRFAVERVIVDSVGRKAPRVGAPPGRDGREGRARRRLRRAALTAALGWAFAVPAAAETYRGIEVAPERRCSPYDRANYRYSQSLEPRIVAALGQVYGPYTGRRFAGTGETDIEHMVATSEAHDSGLCAAPASVRAGFASDLLNLTLAGRSVNRYRKSAKDVAEWIPARNACWFVARTLEVRRKYGLTINRAEAAAAEAVLDDCESTELEVAACAPSAPAVTPAAAEGTATDGEVDALALWDDNGNGRITCAEARRHGIAPVPRGHPAYRHMRDGDGDGVVCE